MSRYRTAEAVVAFDETVWERCGVVVSDTELTISREAMLDLIVWPITGTQVNGPRSMLAYREDGTVVSIVSSGGCRCR